MGPHDAPSTGTTIVACVYRDGVVIGADGRVSTGNYISNRSSNKITPLTDNVYLLRSGSAADAQLVSDYVRYFASQLHAETQEQLSVHTVANLVMQMNYQYKDNLIGALIVAGYDEHEGPQVYGCPIGGSLIREKWAIDGSGSTYIWSFCDNDFREDFTREEAEQFVTEAVALAISRDSSSGGCIRLVTLNKEGAFHKYIPGNQVPLYLDEIQPAGMVVG